MAITKAPAGRGEGKTMRTISEIAMELGVARHRVAWLLADRGIRPLCKVGNCRTFDDAVTELVRTELAAIEARRKGVSA